MKVLYLSPNIHFDGSLGDSVRIRELISSMALKNEVTAIAPAIRDVDYKTLQIFDFKKLRKFKGHSQISATISSFFSLIGLKNVRDYEIIFETLAGPFSVACALKKVLHLPVVVELHGLIDEEERMYNLPRLYTDIIHPMLIRKSLEIADGVITVTQGIRERLCEQYGIREGKIKVIPNGVNTSIFKPMDQSISRKSLNLDQECRYIGFVGNLAPWQGIEYLIKAAPIVLANCKEKVRFLVVGDGVLKEKLMKMVNDAGLSNVFIFTGKVKYEVVPRYINSFDVCVAPFKDSFQGGASPLKVFDYMACGKATVAGNIPGVADLLLSSKSGVVVSPENSNQFAQALVDLLNDYELCQTLGKNGLGEVRRNHDWKARADELNLFLERIIRGNACPNQN